MDNNKYFKGGVKYSLDPETGGVAHNLDRDLHLFILWEYGLPFQEDVRDVISRNFSLLGEYYISWSEEKVNENFLRLYKAIDQEIISNKVEKVGGREFICFIVEDNDPEYRYRQNVSGTIELVNTKVLSCKRLLREKSGGYYVHSSGSPEEFYEQAAILIGPSRLEQVHAVKDVPIKQSFQEDLCGADGWTNFEELFGVLNLSSIYVVLRNFEFLPYNFFGNDKDVDILCDDVADVTSALNATDLKSIDTVCKCNVRVGEQLIPFDIRFVGDDYYHIKWEQRILTSRSATADKVFVPRMDDYFFSLLYHGAIQKRNIKPIYLERLSKLAEKLGFDFVDSSTFRDEKLVARLLEGFLKANGFIYVTPKDPGVHCNRRVLRYIDVAIGGGDSKVLARLVKSFMPARIKKRIPKNIKNRIKAMLN